MAESQQADKWKELRKPFPKEVIGKLPKGGMQLDYVGHAAVTDRMLEVDPTYTWEPFALDERGLPALDDEGNLWIHLTIHGVTRPGVGDGRTMKERIGDALRNAGMRFGIALDLWTKEELESNVADPASRNDKPSQAAPRPAVGSADTPSLPGASASQKAKIFALLTKLGVPRDRQVGYLADVFGIEPHTALLADDAVRVIDGLTRAKDESESRARGADV